MSDEQRKTPYVEPALAEWLSKLFPDECPAENDSDRQVWVAVGAQRVVAKVRAIVRQQQENVLDNDLLSRN
jgi:hypothetical protein